MLKHCLNSSNEVRGENECIWCLLLSLSLSHLSQKWFNAKEVWGLGIHWSYMKYEVTLCSHWTLNVFRWINKILKRTEHKILTIKQWSWYTQSDIWLNVFGSPNKRIICDFSEFSFNYIFAFNKWNDVYYLSFSSTIKK